MNVIPADGIVVIHIFCVLVHIALDPQLLEGWKATGEVEDGRIETSHLQRQRNQSAASGLEWTTCLANWSSYENK